MINTGDIITFVNTDINYETLKTLASFEIEGKATVDKFRNMLELMEEIINEVNLDNKEKIKEYVVQEKLRLSQYIMGAGHAIAMTRVSSYISEIGKYNELINGFSYFKFIENLANNFDELADKTIDIFKNLKGYIFNKENLMINIVLDKENYGCIENELKNFTNVLKNEKKISFDRSSL